MQDADLLLTTAQIGMALAGFAGLVTLLGRARVPGDARLNEIRFRSMMELSLTLALFALLPFVPSELGAGSATAFRIASGIYAASTLAFLVHSARRNRTVMGRTLIQPGVTATLFGVGALICALLFLNAIFAVDAIAQGVYFVALFLHFAAGAFFFIRMLYSAFPLTGSPHTLDREGTDP